MPFLAMLNAIEAGNFVLQLPALIAMAGQIGFADQVAIYVMGSDFVFDDCRAPIRWSYAPCQTTTFPSEPTT